MLLRPLNERFFEILASTYGSGPHVPEPCGPVPLIILKSIVSLICSRIILKKRRKEKKRKEKKRKEKKNKQNKTQKNKQKQKQKTKTKTKKQKQKQKNTAPGAYSKHAPGAVCFSNIVLEQIWFRKFFQIINGPGPYDPGAYGPGPYDPGL